MKKVVQHHLICGKINLEVKTMSHIYKFLGEEYSDKESLSEKVNSVLNPIIENFNKRKGILADLKQVYQGEPVVDNSYEIKALLEIKAEFSKLLDQNQKISLKNMKSVIARKDYAFFLKSIERDIDRYSQTITLIDANVNQILHENINPQFVLSTIENDNKIAEYTIERLEARKNYIKDFEFEDEMYDEGGLEL